MFIETPFCYYAYINDIVRLLLINYYYLFSSLSYFIIF